MELGLASTSLLHMKQLLPQHLGQRKKGEQIRIAPSSESGHLPTYKHTHEPNSAPSQVRAIHDSGFSYDHSKKHYSYGTSNDDVRA